MNKICNVCHFIGKGKVNLNRTIFFMILGILFALFCFDWKYRTDSNIWLILGIVSLVGAFVDFINLSNEGDHCPNCKKKTMILLDKPEAQKILQENNLSVPE